MLGDKTSRNVSLSGAIQVTDKKHIPKDGVLLTEEEAREMQWKLVAAWKPRSDVWPFTYGAGLVGSIAGFSGLVVSKHFRKMLKLGKIGQVASYLPLVVLPTFVSAISHYTFVSSDIIIRKSRCPVCIELRSMFIQLQCGIIYPMIMGPLSTFYLASIYYSAPVPPLSQFKTSVFFFVGLTRPFLGRLTLLTAINCIAAATLCYFEAKSISKVQSKLMDQFTE